MTMNNQLELHTFLIQLQRNINQTKFIKVENNQLYLEEANVGIRELTVISKYKKMIRRQKNRGHEPLLMNVSAFKLKEEENYLTVDILFTNGESYQNRLFYEK